MSKLVNNIYHRACVNVKFNFLITNFGEVREKSSHYGLYMLGFTRATRAKTKRCERVIYSKSLKIVIVLIRD